MNSKEICFLGLSELARLIRKGDLSPREVVQAHLARIESLEPVLNSFITLLPDQAMRAAEEAEREIQAGRYRGALHGIPIALKDLFYVKGVRNTNGSKLFEDFVPVTDATVFSKLRDSGAILLGKLNMHMFAYGPTGENPDYGPMHNPWNPELIAGGSSGGSGSSVASGECTLALGTDTGGSVRIPSSLCGIVGLKPTYGLVSRYGITPLAWSQDHVGPMTRTVEDCALAMNVLAGYDPKDPTSVNLPLPDYTKALTGELKGLRVGVLKDYFEAPIDARVKEVFWKAMDQLRHLGVTLLEVSWPLYRYAMPIASVIQMVEATAYHQPLIRAHAREIDPTVRLRLEAGLFIPATQYVQAERARARFSEESLNLFEKADLLAGPTLPVTAFRIGTPKIEIDGTAIGVIALLTQFTRPFNLNGFPALTLPCGFSEEGLPVGLQLAGRPYEESTLLRVAHAYEQSTEWHRRRPPL